MYVRKLFLMNTSQTIAWTIVQRAIKEELWGQDAFADDWSNCIATTVCYGRLGHAHKTDYNLLGPLFLNKYGDRIKQIVAYNIEYPSFGIFDENAVEFIFSHNDRMSLYRQNHFAELGFYAPRKSNGSLYTQQQLKNDLHNIMTAMRGSFNGI